MSFEQGAYSGELINEMGRADETGRNAFRAVITANQAAGATIELTVNGQRVAVGSEPPWGQTWKTLALVLRKGQLPLGVEGEESDTSLIAAWSSRLAVCLVALLPLEDVEESTDAGAVGLPEGAVARIEVNRYERDRRNRAAALAIHGFSCNACGVKLSDIYGEIALDFIEVHHITPVSQMGANYHVNPATDLVPLCPNCHAIVHRSSQALTVKELKERLTVARGVCTA
ncbi:MAG: HNH endonuclease [Rhodanobacter sp.]